jgi:NAD(P)-dependent dehydrogenase (short-subunit alcohol dehydrogenase family)
MSNAKGQAPANYTPENIAGKGVVVTGGTTGTGLATARLLTERGARVMISGRHQPELTDALSHVRQGGNEAYGIVADVSQAEEVPRIFRGAEGTNRQTEDV